MQRQDAPSSRSANRELVEFRRLVSSVRDYAIFMLDPAGHILSWNAGAEHLKGYAADEIIGRHFSVFYTTEDRARAIRSTSSRSPIREGRYEEEGWRVRKDGTPFWAQRDDHGGPRRRRPADRLRQGHARPHRRAGRPSRRSRDALEELRARQRRSSTASPPSPPTTSPIRCGPSRGSPSCSSAASLTDAEHEYARHIRESSQRLMRMLQGLLVYARAGRTAARCGAGRPRPRGRRRARGSRGPDPRARRRGHRRAACRARRCWRAPPTSASSCRTWWPTRSSSPTPTRPRVRIRPSASDAGTWRVTVEDNGAGHRAPRTGSGSSAPSSAGPPPSEAGYGLGLAICQRLIERHGGELGLDAGADEGSRFWFTLTAGSPPPASSPPSRLPVDREAGDLEAVVGQRLEVVQLLDVAVADLASGAVALPDDRRVVLARVALAVCTNGASQLHASVPVTRTPRSSRYSVASRPMPQPAGRSRPGRTSRPARVLTTTISSGCSSCPMRASSASTSAAVAT